MLHSSISAHANLTTRTWNCAKRFCILVRFHYWQLFFNSRLEITQILKYMVLRASGRGFSDVAASPLIVFLIVVLSVLNGKQLSLPFTVFLLSLSGLVALYNVVVLIRAFIAIFDANTSVRRIQVLSTSKF